MREMSDVRCEMTDEGCKLQCRTQVSCKGSEMPHSLHFVILAVSPLILKCVCVCVCVTVFCVRL